jgi:hypothetical protein
MPISGFIKKPLPRFVDVPPAVKTACVELSKLASVISMYHILCGGGPPCKFAEALEALFLYAAQAGGAREALKVMTGRVPLEALELRLGELALLRSWGRAPTGSTRWPPPWPTRICRRTSAPGASTRGF